MNSSQQRGVVAGLFAVLTAPMLLPMSHAPSPPAYSNALAVFLWGGVLVVHAAALRRGGTVVSAWKTPARWPLVAIAVMAIMCIVHVLAGRYGYLGVTVQGLASLALAAMLVIVGVDLGSGGRRRFGAPQLAWAVLACGAVNAALAWIQYFGWHQPDWWLNSLREMGRVYANLRQPNLLAQVLCLAVVAAVWLRLYQRISVWLTVGALALLVPAVVFTGSRMGFVMLVLLIPLVLWRTEDRKGALLWSILPAVSYLLVWWTLKLLAQQAGLDFYGGSRLGNADATGLRWPLWLNALEISWLHPWLGCGFQQFNYCFTHADLPQRAPANFNHAHNLVLNLVVEFGWPAGILISSLLAYGFWSLRPRRSDAESSLYFALLAIASVHAMLEFPWWHLYFLLPVAFIVGLAAAPRLACPTDARALPVKKGTWMVAGLCVMFAGIYYGWSYASLRPVYTTLGDKISASEGLRRGTRALLFQDHVEYSLVMAVSDGAKPEDMSQILSYFHWASRGHMDAKFLLRYAQVAAIAGETELSKHLMWRALQIDPGVAEEAETAAKLSDHPALRAVVEFAQHPYPVNLPLKRIEAFR